MNFVIENLRVGDKVRIKKNGVEGYLYNIDCIEKRTLELESKEYEIEYVFSVISGTKVYTFLNENDFDLIEQTRTIKDIKKEDLENAIQKFLKLSESIEKYASMGKYANDRKENVSNFEKMTPKLGIKDFKDMIRPNKIISDTNDPLEMIWNSTDEEEPKPSLLTEDERVILRNLDKNWKWIARDEDNELYIFETKPCKESYFWSSEDGNWQINCYFTNLFQFIKWEDDEPYNIEELLKGECVNE